MFKHRHVISFMENGTTKAALPNTSHINDLAQFYLMRERFKCIGSKTSPLPRLNIINDSEIRHVLNPKPLSIFEEFQQDFYATTYSKKPGLGEFKDCKSKPADVNNMSRTFGIPSTVDEPLYGLVLPPKSPNQVSKEFFDGYEMYIKSHNKYYAGKQVRRNYKEPFDPDFCYGIQQKVPKNGEAVKRTMQPCNERVFIRTKQMDFLRAHEAFLGEKFQHGETLLGPDETYGVSTNDLDPCPMKCILENTSGKAVVEAGKPELIQAIAYVRQLRSSLINSPFRRIYDLLQFLKRCDTNKTGFLTLEKIFEVISEDFKLRIDESKIKRALKYYRIIEDAEITNQSLCGIEQFWKFLHLNFSLPEGKSLSVRSTTAVPNSTYRDDYDTHYEYNYVKCKKPPVPVAKLVSPDILSQFDLDESDFRILFPKEKLRRIFGKVVPDAEKFEKIWQQAKSEHPHPEDLVSVSDVRTALQSLESNKV